MTFNPHLWHRITFEDTPVYIRKDRAEWFVPNQSGDNLLCSLPNSPCSGDILALQFMERLPQSPGFDYPGRGAYLKTHSLRELWFHITNRCNLSCTHCLFGSGPGEGSEMSADSLLALADEAASLGCRVFALTGGEPFVFADIDRVIATLLDVQDAHVVVLTNGMTLETHLDHATWDFDRFHLQISVDGLLPRHDGMRGQGTFNHLTRNLKWLQSRHIPYTLSMCVDNRNMADMTGIIDFAADMGAANVHFMWYFMRGRASAQRFAQPSLIFRHLKQAMVRAEVRGIPIDNIKGIQTQIFAPPGTIHDGVTAGWESAAVGPDVRLYPSPALVGVEELGASLSGGLEKAWKNSPVMEKVRKASIRNLDQPFRWLLGGGDLDHSYAHNKTFMGDDPYAGLYEQLALHLIAREARLQKEVSEPRLKLKMGDILESCGAHGPVALVHSNCLLALAQKDSLSVVKDFYHQAATTPLPDILNPVCYSEDLMAHIPPTLRFRGYGCGSPVADAAIRPGDTLVDLGCGGGVECFIASRLVGKNGQVFGIDMTDAMLETARKGHALVRQALGYDNMLFKKGFLEALPLDGETADAVISNCVMNLSVHKRNAYREIFRVLKPGGRLVISDVVCDTEPDPAIANDAALRGECIAGAMTQKDLMGILRETGFVSIYCIRRFPYRNVMGHPFYSLTYAAVKPLQTPTVTVMYRGPLAAGLTFASKVLVPGQVGEIPKVEADMLGDQVFVFNEKGEVVNLAMDNACCCARSPETIPEVQPPSNTPWPSSLHGAHGAPPRHTAGCMVCGAPLAYFKEEKNMVCVYCVRHHPANAICRNGHFVCDACHSLDAWAVILHICRETPKTDMIDLFTEIRKHPAVPVNGPEHHYIVPGIILATYKNLGGRASAEMIETGMQRGRQVSGGYCGFMGVCGAAVGVGIAFSLILEADPVKPVQRKAVQTITQQVLADIAKLEAARCCQRDAWIALTKAAEVSKNYLPLGLKADKKLVCGQQSKNKECCQAQCPLWPAHMDRQEKKEPHERILIF